MLTVRVSVPTNLDRSLTAHIYTVVCPACGKFIAQLDTETTDLNCRHCKKPLADAKGIIERPICRIAWHEQTAPSWERHG